MADAAASADEALELVGPEDRGVALLYRGVVHWRAGEAFEAIRVQRRPPSGPSAAPASSPTPPARG